MIVYLDASAFLKLVIYEQSSEQVREAWLAADRRVSSRLVYPEARAGLARAHRMRRIGRPMLAAARTRVERYIEDTVLLEVTDAVARQAGDLAEQYGLRAYDAVHLATIDSVADEETVLVATDVDLVRAAQDRGIVTAAL